jgi:hypothetical protein
MLEYNKFTGELDGKTINYFMKRLKYSFYKIDDRLKLLNGILYDNGNLDNFFIEYFNQPESLDERGYFKVILNKTDSISEKNYICCKIEKMADYLLLGDEAKILNKASKYPYLTSYKCTKIATNEQSIDSTRDVGADVDEPVNVCNYKKVEKISINSKDINEIYGIHKLQQSINYFMTKVEEYKAKIEKLKIIFEENEDKTISELIDKTQKQLLLCKQVVASMTDNQKFIKLMMKRPIFFKAPLRDSTEYDLSSIDFGNPIHISALLNNYATLKQNSYDRLNGDMKYIIMDLENLIHNTPLKPYEYDILIMKVDMYDTDEILMHLQNTYNLLWNEKNLSKTWRQVIPMKISKQYSVEYEDWYFREVEKGNYKQCNTCGEIKLINKFRKRNDNKGDGYRNKCYDCERSNK